MILVCASVAFHQANLSVTVWMLPGFRFIRSSGLASSIKAVLPWPLRERIALTLGVAALVTANLVAGHFALSATVLFF